MSAMTERLRPAGLFVARVVIGVVFLAHGLQKLSFNGIDGTSKFFDSLGVPAPNVLATTAGIVETVGGIAFILGLLLPLFGVLFAIDLLGAFWWFHSNNGFWAFDRGYEWVIALGVAMLLIAFSGGGPFALDHVLFGRRSRAAGGMDERGVSRPSGQRA